MAEVFDGYERQYCELSTTLARKCSQLGAAQGELKKQKLQELNNGLEEADALIRKMDLEARSLQPTQKVTLLAKLREYKSDLNNLRRDVKKFAANDSLSSRDDLLESGERLLATAAEQRTRLLAASDKLNKTGARIKEGHRTLLETEQIGVSILQDLHSQRETLLHAQERLHAVDDNMASSRKILNSMGRRMYQSQYTLYAVVAVLVFLVVVIMYFKLKG